MIPEFLFYWYYVIITATTGGRVYATGDWRLPLSDADFGDRIEAKWVITGTDSLSSCYAWVVPDEGYHFAGFMNAEGQMVTSADTLNEVRLWTTTDSAQQEDGIVSGNDFYPTAAQQFTAVFESDVDTRIGDNKTEINLPLNDDAYDLEGRKITTPRNGQIIVRNRKEVIIGAYESR